MAPKTAPKTAGQPGKRRVPYEPPKLEKFDKLEKLIVSGE
jgi:hypothetical protein